MPTRQPPEKGIETIEVQAGQNCPCPYCNGASRCRSSQIEEGPYYGRARKQYRMCLACGAHWVTAVRLMTPQEWQNRFAL